MATEDANHPVPAHPQESADKATTGPAAVEPAPASEPPPRWRGHVKAPRAVKPSPAAQKPAAPPAQPPASAEGDKPANG